MCKIYTLIADYLHVHMRAKVIVIIIIIIIGVFCVLCQIKDKFNELLMGDCQVIGVVLQAGLFIPAVLLGFVHFFILHFYVFTIISVKNRF